MQAWGASSTIGANATLIFEVELLAIKCIGFFEAENFHPDFILWLLQDEKQHIAFLDPKGILRLRGLEDPKIMFHKTIKKLEKRLGDLNVTMDAFIISSTSIEDVKWWSGGDILEFNKRNVLFQKEERDVYVKLILDRMSVIAS